MKSNDDSAVVTELAYQFILLDTEIERLKIENKELKIRLENSNKLLENQSKDLNK